MGEPCSSLSLQVQRTTFSGDGWVHWQEMLKETFKYQLCMQFSLAARGAHINQNLKMGSKNHVFSFVVLRRTIFCSDGFAGKK